MDGPAVSRRRLLQGAAVLGAGGVVGRFGNLRSQPRTTTGERADRRRGKPNVIVVFADDMRGDEAPYMPNVQKLLVAEGTTFAAARHNISLCSPARAGFLTGQYSKHHRVRSQHDAFRNFNDVQKTVAVWMQQAGYFTGIVGKYFTTLEGRTSPPGWDFRRQLADNNQQQYGYRVWDGTDLLAPTLDQSRYLQREVLRFLGEATEPFFLWFTPTADHIPFQNPPTHEHDDARVEWPDPREADVSDKPPWIQSLPPIPDRDLVGIRAAQRIRLRELLALDDTIGAIVDSLRTSGQLADTVIMFASDNGILLGEHRIPPTTKNVPYEQAVRVPCIVRGPGFPHTTIREPVQMSVDLTATCVELAGATPTLALDGVSLTRVVADPAAYEDRQLLYDRDDRDNYAVHPVGGGTPPPGAGIFTKDRKLTRYATSPPTYELYDLEADPKELRNIADDPESSVERSELEAALDRLLAG